MIPKHSLLPHLLYFISFTLINVRAQNRTFMWGFNNITTPVNECTPLNLAVGPLDGSTEFQGQPPFYIISYELGGIAVLESIGSDWENLTWIPRHPQGANVIMNVVDSHGNSAGLNAALIQPGNSSNCHPSIWSSPVEVKTNAPEILTCGILNATVSGGKGPYVVSVVPYVQGDVPRNFTMKEGEDTLVYVNKISSGTSFIVTAVDSIGQWGWGTNFISSVGPQNTTCPGEHTETVNSTASLSMPTTPPPMTTTSRTAVFVGIGIGAITFVASAWLGWRFYTRRRVTSSTLVRGGRARHITPYTLPPKQPPNIDPEMANAPLLRAQLSGSPHPLTPYEEEPFHRDSLVVTPTAYREGHIPSYEKHMNAPSPQLRTGSVDGATMQQQRVGPSHLRDQQSTEVYQHLDADEVWELPPAYREWRGQSPPVGRSSTS